MPGESGPWIATAVFCEDVIEDKQGVLTVIRIIDRLTFGAQGPQVPNEMPPIEFPIKLLVGLKAGSARGRGILRVEVESPDGLVHTGPSMGITFISPGTGVNRIFQIQMQIVLEGLYWFNIYFDHQLLTRAPLHVVYVPETIPEPNPPDPLPPSEPSA